MLELEVSNKKPKCGHSNQGRGAALKAADLERTETLFAGGSVWQAKLETARAAHLAQRQKALSIEGALALLPTQRDEWHQIVASKLMEPSTLAAHLG